MTEIVYGTGRIDTGGRAFRNARLFTKPEPEATAVYLAGVFPAIQQAYERVGIPVRTIRPWQAVEPLPVIPATVAARGKKPKAAKTKPPAVHPSDLPQDDAGGLTIRELNVDLEAAHIEIDPADGPAEKLAKLEAVEAE